MLDANDRLLMSVEKRRYTMLNQDAGQVRRDTFLQATLLFIPGHSDTQRIYPICASTRAHAYRLATNVSNDIEGAVYRRANVHCLDRQTSTYPAAMRCDKTWRERKLQKR